MCSGPASRIHEAREKIGFTPSDLAERFGTSRMNIFDLEAYDLELVTAYSLREALDLAALLKISLLELLTGSPTIARRAAFDELAKATREKMQSRNAPLADFEDDVGWYLAEFVSSPRQFTLSNPIIFLQDLCRQLDLDYLSFIPAEPSSGND